MQAIVTTIQHPSPDIVENARSLAQDVCVPYVERNRLSIASISKSYGVENVLVVTKHGPVIHTPEGEYFFHLSMAELRIKNLRNGKHDHMVVAMKLEQGMSVLDCTLGLATDAIVASLVTGKKGKVLGLESSPLIAIIAKLGLQHYTTEDEAINQAMRSIVVEQADYQQYLTCLPDKSFDVVYFDPMFRRPIKTSSNFRPIRNLVDVRPLTVSAVTQACRVARKRVVMKEASNSGEFERLGFYDIVGGKYSSVRYGVMEIAQQEGE